MLQVTAKGNNRVDIDFSGKLDSNDMRAALDELITLTKEIQHGRMLYRISDFEIPTLGAIGVELSHFPELLPMIKKFDRAAVLAEEKWIQKVSEIEGMLFPGLDIKAFNLGEEEQAEAWLELDK